MATATTFSLSGSAARLHKIAFRFGQGTMGCIVAQNMNSEIAGHILANWPIVAFYGFCTLTLVALAGVTYAHWNATPLRETLWGFLPGIAGSVVSLAAAKLGHAFHHHLHGRGAGGDSRSTHHPYLQGTSPLTLLVLFPVFAVTLYTGVPVAWSIALSTLTVIMTGMVLLPPSWFAQQVFVGADSISLAAIPVTPDRGRGDERRRVDAPHHRPCR